MIAFSVSETDSDKWRESVRIHACIHVFTVDQSLSWPFVSWIQI